MKKILYFACLMASSLAFSAENVVQVPTPRKYYNTDPEKQYHYRKKSDHKMRLYRQLTKAFTQRNILSPDTLALERKGSYATFTPAQQTIIRQAFDAQPDAVKTAIAHDLASDPATLAQQLQEFRLPFSVPPKIPKIPNPLRRSNNDLAKRARRKKYSAKTSFFPKLAIQLVQQKILPPNTIALKRNGTHFRPLTRDQHATLLQAFRECQSIETKDAIAQELSKAHAPLVEQLLGVTIPPPENRDFATQDDGQAAWTNSPIDRFNEPDWMHAAYAHPTIPEASL